MRIQKQAEQHGMTRTGSAWTAEEALDQLGQTAQKYALPEELLDCRECWNSAEANAYDEANDPQGYDYGKPVWPLALDWLGSSGDLRCEDHS